MEGSQRETSCTSAGMPGAPRCSDGQQAILQLRLSALALDFLQAQRQVRLRREQAHRVVERLAIELNEHQRKAQAALAAMREACEDASKAAACGEPGASEPLLPSARLDLLDNYAATSRR